MRSAKRSHRRPTSPRLRDKFKPRLELLEDRNLLDNGLWYAVFKGVAPGADLQQQTQVGRNLLQSAGVSDQDIHVVKALDLTGTFAIETSKTALDTDIEARLGAVPGFYVLEDLDADALQPSDEEEEPGADLIDRDAIEAQYGEITYDDVLSREKNGLLGGQGGPVDPSPNDVLINNNNGNSGAANFTQSETSVVAFGNNVVVAFNDSGSFTGGANKFTGFAYSTDGGNTFTDGGTLPTNPGGDAGDPVLARDNVTGRIYFATLGFTDGLDKVFHSDDNGVTWSAPANGTPGGSSEDKEWIAVDNFPGASQGNVYLVSRNFGGGNGIFFYRSTDHGLTFGPTGGTAIALAGSTQGAFVTVTPDHAVEVFWFNGSVIQMRKSTDFGVTFGPTVTVTSGLIGGVNGDLGLTGLRQGTSTFSGFRSSEFPHAAVNPVSGNIYVTYDNKGAGTDKADVFLVQSTDGGATWSAPLKVNDDATTTDQWQPTIAVTPGGDKLGVFYYSRQEDPAGNNLFKYYGRVASISGSTLSFAPSFAVSSTPSLPEFGRDSVVNSVYMGDYNTAYATAGAFHVSFSDNRDDLPGGAGRKDPNAYYQKIALGLAVTTTVPAVGSIVSTIPTDYVVNFTDPIQTSTVQASDFQVDGINASSFVINTSQQVTFHFNTAPFSTQGLHTMTMPAGAILRDPDGSPLAAFSGTFRYDAVTLTVTSTVPPVGGTFTLPGPFTYDVNFNEPVDPASVQASDLSLSGIAGAVATGVTVLPGNTTARFTIGGVTSEGTLTASIAAGAITDQFGNPGAAFTGNYFVDIGTVPYPTPLGQEAPAGSQIYDPTQTGIIGPAGDTDSFTLNIDPGQTISVLLTPAASLRPTIDVLNPSNVVVATSTAGAAGQNALVQTISSATGGTYTFRVSGAGGTTGSYTLRVTLNAALENEGLIPGASDNTPATAQNINASFTTQTAGLGTAQRGAAQGMVDSANYSGSAVPSTFEDISGTGTVITGLDGQDDNAVSIPIGFTFGMYGTNYTTIFVSSNGLLTFGTANTAFTNADLTTTPAQAAIAPYWDDLFVTGAANSHVYFQVLGSGSNQHLDIQWNNISYFADSPRSGGLTFEAQLYADGRVQFNYPSLITGRNGGSNDNGASATVGIKDVGTQGPNRLLLAFNNGPNAFVGNAQSTLISPPNPAPDYYSFSAVAGETVTLASRGGSSSVALTDAGGVVLATGVGGSTNVDSTVANFVIPTTGTYLARVTGAASGTYNLVVTRNAAFDTEANDTAATAQPFGKQGAVGAITPVTTYIASAVTFTFEDISSTGTAISGLDGQDDASVSIPIGFTFPFFGVNNTAIFVSSNGLLTFGSANTEFTNADMTSDPTQAAIAPYWDDQFITGGATTHVYSQVLGSGSNQHLTIQWNNVSYFSDSPRSGGLTYEAQLYADGRIQLNFQSLATGNNGGSNDNAVSATVGIKAAGTQGPNRLLLDFNGGANTFVGSGKSTLISQPAGEDWYSTTLAAGQTTLAVGTSTPADGSGEFVNVLNPKIELYDSTGTTLIASGVPGADGRNELIVAGGLTPGATYKVRVLAQGGTTGEYFVGVGTAPAATPTQLVDNTSFGFTTRGTWSLVSGGYGGSYRQIAGNGDGSSYAQWQYSGSFTAGNTYGIYVTWTAAPGNATNARYKIFDGATQIGTVFLNQTQVPNSVVYNGALWQSLFVYTPATTGFHVIRVQVDNTGNGNVIADALFDPPLGAALMPAPQSLAALTALDAAFSGRGQIFGDSSTVFRPDLALSLLGPARQLQGTSAMATERFTVKQEEPLALASYNLDAAFSLLGEKRSRLDTATRSRRSSAAVPLEAAAASSEESADSSDSDGAVAEQEPNQE